MTDRPSVLLVDASQLRACSEALAQIGSDFEAVEGAGAVDVARLPRDLLVTAARGGVELARRGPLRVESLPVWVCVDGDDLGARRELSAAGVDYFVRVDAGAQADRELLRLLFLQVLYEGVERRGEARLLCSREVEYRVSGSSVRGRLMDLSRGGFRLLGPRPLASETPLELTLPADLDPGPAAAYTARVRRCSAALRGPAGQERTSIVARFVANSPAQAARIAAVLDSCAASAPAILRRRPILERERRLAARHRYAGVAAVRCLDADEYCIVQGTELSLAGMRLAFHPGLDIGSELSIGLHTGRGQPAVMLRGRVRHHDPSGLGVEFTGVRPAEGRVLEALIDALPRHGAVCSVEGADPIRPLLLCEVRV